MMAAVFAVCLAAVPRSYPMRTFRTPAPLAPLTRRVPFAFHMCDTSGLDDRLGDTETECRVTAANPPQPPDGFATTRHATDARARLLAAVADADAEASISQDMLNAALMEEEQMNAESMQLMRASIRAERAAEAAVASYNAVRTATAYDAYYMTDGPHTREAVDDAASPPWAGVFSLARGLWRWLRRQPPPEGPCDAEATSKEAQGQDARAKPQWTKPPKRIGLRLVEVTANARRIEARARAQKAAEAAHLASAATERVAALRARVLHAVSVANGLRRELASLPTASEQQLDDREQQEDREKHGTVAGTRSEVGDLGAAVHAAVGEEAAEVVAEMLGLAESKDIMEPITIDLKATE